MENIIDGEIEKNGSERICNWCHNQPQNSCSNRGFLMCRNTWTISKPIGNLKKHLGRIKYNSDYNNLTPKQKNEINFYIIDKRDDPYVCFLTFLESWKRNKKIPFKNFIESKESTSCSFDKELEDYFYNERSIKKFKNNVN